MFNTNILEDILEEDDPENQNMFDHNNYSAYYPYTRHTRHPASSNLDIMINDDEMKGLSGFGGRNIN